MDKKKELKRKPLTEAKRISMSFEGQQQSALLCLLYHEGYNIQFSVPRKSSEICQFLDVTKIWKGNEVIDLVEEVKVLVSAGSKDVNPESKHHVKYERRNMMAATVNFIIGMLTKLGVVFKEKGTKGSTITLKMKKIKSIKFNNIEWDSERIADIGEIFNARIKEYFKGKKRQTIVDVENDKVVTSDLMTQSLERSAFKKIEKDKAGYVETTTYQDEATEEENENLERLKQKAQAALNEQSLFNMQNVQTTQMQMIVKEEDDLPKIENDNPMLKDYVHDAVDEEEFFEMDVNPKDDVFEQILKKEPNDLISFGNKGLENSNDAFIDKQLHKSTMINSHEGFMGGAYFNN
ncbi:hypothetical protein EIN_056990 [Entamoeba invadens IP1]|uniref:hypothetical protein n=1 Tax=Entamoeba invadens IP1 TaxID=370355 RepID=UPI0002C3E2C6|nr:hypothetical protein EIN_056990 [Entamoeba invadens IP1]ELP93314.1 hypothetical protein EIN_056990 [Entamoeba invadens IP1]|eukprot:XP_004260085.1 hypothetical protein EIN_056990 [Entamoeba invadens IP1]